MTITHYEIYFTQGFDHMKVGLDFDTKKEAVAYAKAHLRPASHAQIVKVQTTRSTVATMKEEAVA